MKAVIGDTKQTVQQIAQQVAKQIAQEPMEVLKTATTQVTGVENRSADQSQPTEQKQSVQGPTPELKKKITVQGQNTLQALEAEIKDIQAQKAQEKVSLVQVEEMQKQKEKQEQARRTIPQVVAKTGRRMNAGQHKIKQQQTRIESPVAPSQ